MGKISFNLKEESDFTMVSFDMNGVIEPKDLLSIKPPTVNGSKGVVLCGRGPIWLYCFLTHFYHPTKFIATYDPRMERAVIVERHVSDYEVGSIIKC